MARGKARGKAGGAFADRTALCRASRFTTPGVRPSADRAASTHS